MLFRSLAQCQYPHKSSCVCAPSMDMAIGALTKMGGAAAAGISCDAKQSLNEMGEYEDTQYGTIVAFQTRHGVLGSISTMFGAAGSMVGLGGGGSQSVQVHIAGAGEPLKETLKAHFDLNNDITFNDIKNFILHKQDRVDDLTYNQNSGAAIMGVFMIFLKP